MEIVAQESLGFIDNVRTMNLDERLAKLKHLGSLLSETLKRGEEKVALAKSTYDTVCICCDEQTPSQFRAVNYQPSPLRSQSSHTF